MLYHYILAVLGPQLLISNVLVTHHSIKSESDCNADSAGLDLTNLVRFAVVGAGSGGGAIFCAACVVTRSCMRVSSI